MTDKQKLIALLEIEVILVKELQKIVNDKTGDARVEELKAHR